MIESRRVSITLKGDTFFKDVEETFLYSVTVKLPPSVKHTVFADFTKVKGTCPISTVCTDVNGKHHNLIVRARSTNEIEALLGDVFHITRIEFFTVSDIIDVTNRLYEINSETVGFGNTELPSVAV